MAPQSSAGPPRGLLPQFGALTGGRLFTARQGCSSPAPAAHPGRPHPGHPHPSFALTFPPLSLLSLPQTTSFPGPPASPLPQRDPTLSPPWARPAVTGPHPWLGALCPAVPIAVLAAKPRTAPPATSPACGAITLLCFLWEQVPHLLCRPSPGLLSQENEGSLRTGTLSCWP